jgi:hypothetical protein
MSLCVLATVAACGDSQPAPAPTPSTRELLSGTVGFDLGQPGSALAITIKRLNGPEMATHRVALPVPAGSLALHADARGDLRLDELQLRLDDIVVDAEDLPPAGLHLTDLRVTVDTDIADTSWSADGSSAIAALTAAVTLEWSLVSEGRVLPLAPQEITAVDLVFEVGPSPAGGVSVTVRGGHPGTVLRPAGAFEISDLTLELNAQD